ncbi:MAG TPA: hypothetical protein DDZ80_16405 [Cyanobacteria bacterium UBA8803]|nr:hypothetical protein [Cyanobacteria bacterium UBA9273]HBL59994.1 hypothetical protein [Cyanobacteria bacterium UBA8803]
MANDQHFVLLKQGVEAWNQWRENNDQILPDLSGADLSRANLNEANLSMANLNQVDLRMANLSDADLTRADLRGADLRGANLRGANLNQADLTGTDLSGAHLTLVNMIESNLTWVNLSEANLKIANLTRANLSEANLRMANLSGANLSEVNFRMANLSDANLRMANLSGANLEKSQALDTNFNKAIFTSACLEGWQTNTTTILSEVICDYVYLQLGQQERRPERGNFEPGEFIKWWRKGLDRVDFVVNHQGSAVQDYEVANYTPADNLSNTVVEIPELPQPIQDQSLSPTWSEVVEEIQDSPQPLPPSIKYESKYESLSPNWLDQVVEIQPPPQPQPIQQPSVSPKWSDKFVEIPHSPPSRPQIIHSNPSPTDLPQAVEEIQNLLDRIDKDFAKSKWSDVAVEIQQLLQGLTQTYSANTPLEKVILVAAAIKQMESNPPLKANIMEAVQEAGIQTLEELVGHSLGKLFLTALADW